MARRFDRKQLPDSSLELLLYPDFFGELRAQTIFENLKSELDWKQGEIKLFGKEIPEPRLTAWYGDFDYQYSNKRSSKKKFTQTLLSIQRDLMQEFDIEFNGVLCNWYRHGQDSMSWHSDDEKELETHTPIVSLSFGASRKMKFRKKSDRTKKLDLILEHGSLLLMPPEVQVQFQHAIPNQSRADGRINLTFRRGG
jgi:alkylated DNA repair dioxygenase AlkB